jgi:predicted nucleic acid-binding protein
MTIYVDASALLKRYVDEPDSATAEAILGGDEIASGRHVVVEVRRNLARLAPPGELAQAQERFADDLKAMAIVELDEATCETAAGIAEATGVRTLDALHLACATRLGGNTLPFVTYDIRQAQAARSLGFTVLGA